jgi:hypothetical protein
MPKAEARICHFSASRRQNPFQSKALRRPTRNLQRAQTFAGMGRQWSVGDRMNAARDEMLAVINAQAKKES